jgi:Cu/Ag efflux protein CusF
LTRFLKNRIDLPDGQNCLIRLNKIESLRNTVMRIGTNPVVAACRRRVENPEASMKAAKITLAGGAILAILGSAAFAQQVTTANGMITKIDRTTGVIAIQRTQEGTVGANSGAAEEFKLQGGSLDAWHAGDRVAFTATEAGGVKTITKIEKQ